MVSKERKLQLVKKFGRNAKDTGFLPVQIAILTEDIHSMRGFMAKVNHRKDLLNHLKNENYDLYEKTIKELNIRK